MHQEAIVIAKCGEPERRSYLRRLAALGLPVSLSAGGETTGTAAGPALARPPA